MADDCDYGEQVGSGVRLAMLDFRSVDFAFTGFWVVHFKGGYAEISVEISFKMGPARPPRILGWGPGRVLSIIVCLIKLGFLV